MPRRHIPSNTFTKETTTTSLLLGLVLGVGFPRYTEGIEEEVHPTPFRKAR
jgi:hypothetical protein